MTLATKLTREFDSGVRRRGFEYFRDGLVRIHTGSESEVEARVRGSHNYEVSLTLPDDVLVAWCACPFFASDLCKHLWATILACDRLGYLSAALSVKDLFIEEFDEDYEPYEIRDSPRFSRSKVAQAAASAAPAPIPPRIAALAIPAWRTRLVEVENRRTLFTGSSDAWPEKRQIVYTIDLPSSAKENAVILLLESRDQKKDGSWKSNTGLRLKRSQVPHLPQAHDRDILSLLQGGNQYYSFGYTDTYSEVAPSWMIKPPLVDAIMPLIVQSGRCYLRSRASEYGPPLSWDNGGPWRFVLQMRKGKSPGWIIAGDLQRGEERMDLSTPALLTAGMVFAGESVAPLAADTPFEWLAHLRQSGSIEAPEEQGDELLGTLLGSRHAPAIEVCEELSYAEVTPQPRPNLKIHAARGSGKLQAELSFDYQGWYVAASAAPRGRFNAQARQFVRRNPEMENAATRLLAGLGVKRAAYVYGENQEYEISAAKLPHIVRSLALEGWHIEADGKVFRSPGAHRMGVSSGVDWFELRGEVNYGDATAQLPELLQALRRGENMVRLSDGSYGLLPEEWLRRFGHLAGLGTAEKDHIRFRSSQAGLLDALLATQPEAHCDETFARVRRELCSFEGVHPAEQPAGFAGQLRDYQRDGLGWMHFLRRFSLGGCLADDMGVGKTAQVLALLETRRELRAVREVNAPSLVVVPKSLVFNWKLEAARFTPNLRVLEYVGQERKDSDFSKYDIVLTTYGTLRRDAPRLQDVEFDYVVLDEAQAIKNSDSESAKAARLLRADHRLALSGTPVENHLGELWSLFEFLNPGMLGASAAFKFAEGATRAPTEETRSGAGSGAAAVHPAPHQGTSCARTAAQGRADGFL